MSHPMNHAGWLSLLFYLTTMARAGWFHLTVHLVFLWERSVGRRLIPAGPAFPSADKQGRQNMLLWIAIILAVLWLLGLLGSIGGGFIHLLLVVAVVVLIFHFVRGRSRV
ncbi:lmo0937 family membrane protein [Arthrobacter sp. AL08]|uniref:lmo0937 family membrane protein n=1 Tax=Micrococcaceae TaxID=1268 RepID=UPI00249A9688|nr:MULTISPECIES: lmo0937 family membrane protein [Micrococcaceae]MDI3243377.1 lmo0937 family membrane protein [Arthrobacter sp. AL05]MDI3279399.1 lmo0937 family membrane protein [Arthrobacter sp. AL08]